MAAVLLLLLGGPNRSRGGPAASISVSGGMQAGTAAQPLLFTWNSPIPLEGSGWGAGETVAVALEGPLNSPGVAAESVALGTLAADNQGTFSSSLTVPYDGGATGTQTRIPRPGLYQVQATGSASGTVAAAYPINLCPATYTGGGATIDWSYERGTRVGVLPGPLAAYSPERADPNWISVWDNRPTEVYGTVAGAGTGGDNQPGRVSYEDDPLTHYAHDTNFYLLPDPQYRWTVGTANYYSNGEDESGLALGRIEVEWEALNAGSTESYGTGQIGLPDWAIATSGDRMYVVGRWVLDAGHPEVGDRTEMHPPRLVAVMRQRPTVSNTSAAAQVDIYVSGHGGAANRYPSGMDALLDQGGHGGGRMRDVLSASDQQTYYQAGPVPFLQLPILALLVQQLTGQSLAATVHAEAGPSAFSWGSPAPESQPVNDTDYDFDVPLPPAPAGSTSVSVEVVTHAQHTTAVTEAISYGGGPGGLPAAAHIHLPYRGADNGVYARTLKFSWNAPAPQNHFRVTVDHVTVNAMPGEWHLWSDVSGQWTYLPGIAPALLKSTQGQTISTAGMQSDVYLHDGDTLRVLVQGYRAQCVDHLFGTLFGMGSYSAGIQLLENCGPVNNDDLGGALLELPALPSSQGSYEVKADAADQAGGGAFAAAVTVEYVNPVQVPADCAGRGGLAPAIAAGGVVGAGLSQPRVTQISPDGLISVFGQNFAPPGTARSVTAGDVRGGALPANLACTCVAVNHHLAPLLYVSPSLINVQAPGGGGDGSASVQVIANCGAAGEKASAPVAAGAQSAAPEFFFFQQSANGVNPVAATNAVTGSLVGAAGLLPGATFAPAKPGDFVALYATGLGSTDPPIPTGALARQAARTVFPVTVTLNGVRLAASDVLYAGTAPGFAGLYQINIRIPADAPAGDLAVSLSIAGMATPAGAFLTVQR